MATPRRRSARLNGAASQQRTPGRKGGPIASIQLESLVERDETPDADQQQQSIDNVLATPTSQATVERQLSMLSQLTTPKTEPRPERGEMHPKTIHQTTTKAPDSGLKLGFVDAPAYPRNSLASIQNTPSKSKEDLTQHANSPVFQFKFGSEPQLSAEAQKLMDNVKQEAAQIKVQMQAEKDAQALTHNQGINATGRKIAKPKGKAGRFSDVHMAEFKKMDSIANHASAYRAKSYIQAAARPLKRSGSRAGLDEPERPRTAGKGTPGKAPHPFTGSQSAKAKFPQAIHLDNASPTKRQRQSSDEDVSTNRTIPQSQSQSPVRPSLIPKSPKALSSRLLSPTKSSLAKASQIPTLSPNKSSAVIRSNSIKSTKTLPATSSSRPTMTNGNTKSLSQPISTKNLEHNKPLPAVPSPVKSQPMTLDSAKQSKSPFSLPSATKTSTFASKIPGLSGIKSILRNGRKSSILKSNASPTPQKSSLFSQGSESAKKVDFTPSVKSRYAVKLAAQSPSPAKMIQLTPRDIHVEGNHIYSLGIGQIEDEDSENWEDAESEIEYPSLPEIEHSGPVVHTFTQKSKEQNRRESKEFKSIFTTLHHPSRSSTSSTPSDMTVNEPSPAARVNVVTKSPNSKNSVNKPKPTIRRVRASGISEPVQPFEDAHVNTVPHGLPGKKRRRESDKDQQRYSADDSKENRRFSIMPQVPGAWEDTVLEEDEGEKRGGKRARLEPSKEVVQTAKPEIKKPSIAREAAAKNAKDRKEKSKGVLTLSRLNLLSKPKQRA